MQVGSHELARQRTTPSRFAHELGGGSTRLYTGVVGEPEGGLTVASWTWQLASRRMYMPSWATVQCARERPLAADGRSRDPFDMRGAVYPRSLNRAAAVASGNAHCLASVRPGEDCAGYEYPAVAEGEEDLVFFWRTLPRDHAPGVLLVNETGGAALGLDGTGYLPRTPGLVVTSTEAAGRL